MRRRQLFALVGAAVATWPPVARAQQATKEPMPTVGFLGPVKADEMVTVTFEGFGQAEATIVH
jgi:hypothetical protein